MISIFPFSTAQCKGVLILFKYITLNDYNSVEILEFKCYSNTLTESC